MKFSLVILTSCLATTTLAIPFQNGAIPEHVLEKFKEKQGIKADFELPLQALGPDKKLKLADGSSITLTDLQPKSVFAASARCYDDGQLVPCPSSTVSTRTDANTSILVAHDAAGNVASVKVRQGQGPAQVFQAVTPGVFTSIPDEALDPDFASRFILQDKDTQVRRQLRQRVERQLQGPCTEFRVVEVAVAVESSFCADVGGTNNVDAKVQSIMADVAFDYEQEGLCFTTVISHYEKFCDAAEDPYVEGVASNLSGCGGTGLLDFFQNYWNNNRQGVARDVAELFSGTGLECSSQGCVIGCAYVRQTCSNPSASYGVNWVSYTSNTVAQSNLVSHEIGHTVGEWGG